ncbi:uncharacterized protein LY79DRAFT_32552 [Colletotrichum navitas]|uniref:Uncharacterized protein n=1 Tax=Colletotrichum navitas TaxID=681940 RepID=A0AAD8V9I3_9PEZI|nr:uncharacterized protein LY79DRAFT_32552 [Colletotrichum navitas]KAK1596826.1 hypothetical protein LY79DRAFT_32552 [Colletotrichum navitas]
MPGDVDEAAGVCETLLRAALGGLLLLLGLNLGAIVMVSDRIGLVHQADRLQHRPVGHRVRCIRHLRRRQPLTSNVVFPPSSDRLFPSSSSAMAGFWAVATSLSKNKGRKTPGDGLAV